MRGVRPASIDWIVPPAVRAGDVVGVCAPSGPIRPARFDRGLALLAPHLRLTMGDDVRADAGYLAGDDRRRADELTRLLRDPDVRAILVARGGYGITRMLGDVDPAWLRADPKPIVAFSDGTALLAWAALAGVRAIHGPVVSQLGDLPEDDVRALVRAVTDPRPAGTVAQLAPLVDAAPIAGALVPANLKMLAHQIATPWQIDPADAVLLLEEVGEKPYAIDRDLTQLALAGLLTPRAVVLGDLTRCTEPASAPGMVDDAGPARAVVAERLAAYRVPAWRGAPVGHGARNLALPMGARVEIDATGRFAVLDAAVR
ncbi:MAG: LD-carboxypeptidase [Myxococcales bacterium]|nr:LD-carboxypeptidase [Myxococcales bacterium]